MSKYYYSEFTAQKIANYIYQHPGHTGREISTALGLRKTHLNSWLNTNWVQEKYKLQVKDYHWYPLRDCLSISSLSQGDSKIGKTIRLIHNYEVIDRTNYILKILILTAFLSLFVLGFLGHFWIQYQREKIANIEAEIKRKSTAKNLQDLATKTETETVAKNSPDLTTKTETETVSESSNTSTTMAEIKRPTLEETPKIPHLPKPNISEYINLTLENKHYVTQKMATNSVVLTFDDGPSEEYTPQVLKILKNHQVKATFFLVGKRVEKRCDLVKQIAREGHEIGNHTYNHPFLWNFDEQGQRQEIERTQKIIQECLIGIEPPTYNSPSWFRAPYAAQNETTKRVANQLGLHTVLWTIDTNDWQKNSTPSSIINAAINTNGRAIILMHDATEANPDWQSPKASNSRQNTVNSLDKIIINLKNKGLQFMTISEAFN